MRLLLDSHAFLWFVLDDPRLGASALGLIGDVRNEILISPATFWEIAIKISLGKYTLRGPFGAFMQDQIAQNGFAILPIGVAHAARVASLPSHHRDPFDRLLIAQAMAEEIPILSADPALDAYAVTRIW